MKTLALKKKLFERKQWLRLLHYKKSIFTGYKSEADGKGFFNAPDGRTNPEAEMRATIDAFFYSRATEKGQQAQCKFVARYNWLKSQLQFNETILPPRTCKRFNKWRQALEPETITIVFSSFFINSPVSAMGHTLLKLNKKHFGVKQPLLDYGVNYAANADLENTNILVYAFAGIFGGYNGTFSIYPYYLKVNEYNNAESRDLWEYELDLNQNQVDLITQHLWELGSTHFDYFYFDENCSYQLLTLIEVARLDVNLSDQFFYVVQPMDTVRLLNQQGLIRKIIYRPSQLNKFKRRYDKLNKKARKAFHTLLDGELAHLKTLPVAEKVAVIDAGIDYFALKKFEASERKLGKEQTKIYDNVLLLRSKIDYEVKEEQYRVLGTDIDPLFGHHTSTLQISGGYSKKGAYTGVTFMPALREVIDSPIGYAPFSQILFLQASFRFHKNSDEVPQLNYFRVLDILSMAPFSKLFKNISWAVSTGFENRRNEYKGDENPYQIFYYFNAGAGFSYRFVNRALNRFLFFGFIKPRIEVANSFEQSYRLGSQFDGGIIVRLSKNSQLISTAVLRWLALGDKTDLPFINNIFNYRINESFALEISHRHYFLSRYYEMGMNLKYYF